MLFHQIPHRPVGAGEAACGWVVWPLRWPHCPYREVISAWSASTLVPWRPSQERGLVRPLGSRAGRLGSCVPPALSEAVCCPCWEPGEGSGRKSWCGRASRACWMPALGWSGSLLWRPCLSCSDSRCGTLPRSTRVFCRRFSAPRRGRTAISQASEGGSCQSATTVPSRARAWPLPSPSS